MEVNNERRLAVRGRGDLEWLFVIQIDSEHAVVVTETKDISSSGIHCRLDAYFPKDSIVDITILLPLTEKGLIFEKIKCKGRTIRCALLSDACGKEYHDVAFTFHGLTDAQKTKIEGYVRHVQEIC